MPSILCFIFRPQNTPTNDFFGKAVFGLLPPAALQNHNCKKLAPDQQIFKCARLTRPRSTMRKVFGCSDFICVTQEMLLEYAI